MNQKLIISVVVLATLIGFISCQEVCVQCTSENDQNCVTSPGDIPPVPCPASNNTCLSHIVNGHVVRGCGDTIPNALRGNCSVDVSDCELCIQISVLHAVPCNNRIFPQNRLSCHQCEGNLNTTCGQVPTGNPTMCIRFSRNDQCFVRRNGDNVIRGCLSADNSCPQGRCISCSGNGCNIMSGNATEIPDENSAMGQKENSLVLAFATLFSVFVLKKLF